MNEGAEYAELLTEYGRQVNWSTRHLLNLTDELRLLREKLRRAEFWAVARTQHERAAIRRRSSPGFISGPSRA